MFSLNIGTLPAVYYYIIIIIISRELPVLM